MDSDLVRLRGLLDDMSEPLHMVLRWNQLIPYPCCPWAAASLAARLLRESGYSAEVVPLIRFDASEPTGLMERLSALPVPEREPHRIRELFGEDILKAIVGKSHEAVGVRVHDGERLGYQLVDFILPKLSPGVCSDSEYVFCPMDSDILQRHGLLIVSAKFVRCQSFQSCLFGRDLGPVTIDLDDDYKAFKRLVDEKRRGR